MRILHMSDTHVGFSAYHRVTPDGLNQREQDFFDGFRRAIDLAIAERVDVVLHSGDLFDSVRPSNRALSFVMSELQKLAVAKIPFVVISGNHEAPRLRETGAVLRLLEFIPGVRAVYKGQTEVVRVKDLAIHATPHAASNEALIEQLRSVKPADGVRFNVAAFHAGVMGVGDFRTGEFNEQTVPQNEIPAGMDYVAIGHYHRATEIAPRVWYAGSTERCSFKEAPEAKSVNLVDLEKATVEVRILPTRAMIDLPPLPCAGMTEESIPGELYARLARTVDGAIARLKVTGLPPHVYSTLDFARIKTLTAGALHFDLQAEIDRTEAQGASAESLGSLPDEFVSFLDKRALQGDDREAIVDAAKSLLREAEATL